MSWSLSEEIQFKEELDDDCENSDCEEQFNNNSDSDLPDEDLQKCLTNFLPNNDLTSSNCNYYLCKDKKTVWNKNCFQKNNDQPAIKTEVLYFPDLSNCDKLTPLDCWELIFYDKLIEDIVKFTNNQLEQMKVNYSRDRDCALTNVVEIRALLGLLYMAGVQRCSHLNLRELWSKDETVPVYFRLVMSQNRFYTLLSALRFDDITTTNKRKQTDKFAPIRDIFENFNQKCTDVYTPGEYCTLDEIFETFGGKCSFRQYIANSQYGIRIFLLFDSETYYVSKMEVSIKDQPDGPFKITPEETVKKLIQPISNSGRNITIDSSLTTVPLAEELLTNHNLTCVASLRKNKPEVPEEFLNLKKRSVNHTMVAYKNNMTLLSHVSKKKKNLILLSTLHAGQNLQNESQKLDVVNFYNRSKSSLQILQKLKSEFNVARHTSRWPLLIFFTMLNVAGINSQIIYKNSTSQVVTRRVFLKQLAHALSKPYLEVRAFTNNLPNDLRLSIRKYLNINNKEQFAEQSEENQVENKIMKCHYCPKRKNRKTTSFCYDCSKPVCREHTVKFCFNCCDKKKDQE